MDELFMVRPGPKPANVERLKAEATDWAVFFYKLRDGQPGMMVRVEYKPATREQLQQIGWYGYVKRHPELKRRSKPETGRHIKAPIIIPVSQAATPLPAEMKVEGWEIWRPLQPAPELWEQLKQARSAAAIKNLCRRIRQWMDREFQGTGRWLPGNPAVEFPDVLKAYAENVLAGMELPSYAKTERPRSDDKRVNHLAKVLAGARLGLAPITAAKRLSHWSVSRDWATKSLSALVEGEKQRIEGQQ